MWSKSKIRHMPISIRLTLLYSIILIGILLFTSCLTFTGLLYVLFIHAKADLRQSAANITRYIEKANIIDSKLLEENLLLPGIILKIYDRNDSLVIDSDARKSNLHGSEQANHQFVNHKFTAMKNEVLQLIDPEPLYFYEEKKQVALAGHLFTLHFMKPMIEQSQFLKSLVVSLIITNILGLIIAILAGTYISNRALRPIRNITETARKIEIQNLGRRIILTDNKDELTELAKTFNHMLDRIQEGFEKQRRFVADASHELKTPITVITGYAEMLDSWGKQDPSSLQEGIEAIKSEADNMYGLVEKLLFLARADQKRQILNKARLDTNPLIEELFKETGIIAPHHEVILTQNDPVSIYADPASIKQMLRIFIENSIKYTPAGGKIIIYAKKMDHYFEVGVKDTGIGIPDKDIPYVFNRFYRVDKSRSKSTGGTGLGLSIASWLAEQHNSTIYLASKLGEGTTIKVHIPLNLEYGG